MLKISYSKGAQAAPGAPRGLQGPQGPKGRPLEVVRMTLEGTSLLKLQETCFTDLNGATNEHIQIPYILQFQSLLTLELAKNE